MCSSINVITGNHCHTGSLLDLPGVTDTHHAPCAHCTSSLHLQYHYLCCSVVVVRSHNMRAAFTTATATVGTRSSTLHGARVCTSGGVAITPAANARVRMAFTSIGGILTEAPVSMPNEASFVICAVYKQVLGNAHFMESEREELSEAESALALSSDVRTFVGQVAKSYAYTSRFVDNVSAYRCVELLFKHLLARAPSSKEEYATVMAVIQQQGYAAAVDYFVQSREYDELFGAYTVPYPVYRGAYSRNDDFNRAVALRGAPAGSDKNRAAVLQYAVCSGDSPNWLSIARALPVGTEKGSGFSAAGRWASSVRNKKSGGRVGTKIPGGVVFY